MAELEGSTVMVRARGHLSAHLDGEAVVLGLDKGLYYGMNDVAARVWGLLEVPRRVDDVVDLIVAEYDVDHETCERDVLRLLIRLRNEGMAEVASAG